VVQSGPSESLRALEALELTHDAIVACDLAGRVVAWNRAASALYGYAAEDALGRTFELLAPTEVDGGAQAMRASVVAEGHWQGSVERRTATGELRMLAVRAMLHRDADGRASEIVEAAQDVTDSHRHRAALDRSEHRYRNLFGAMAASFWELDFSPVGAILRQLAKSGVKDLAGHLEARPDEIRAMMRLTRVLDVNDQTVATFGRGSKDEMLRSVEPFWPESSNRVFLASVLAAISGKPSYSEETRLRSIDGREIDALFTACFPSESVAQGKVLVGVIDISARKRAYAALDSSEQRYRYLFHYMPIALWQLDASALVGVFKALRAEGVTDLGPRFDTDPTLLPRCLDAVVVREVNQHTIEMLGGRDAKDFTGPVTPFWRTRPETFRRAMEARYRGEPTFQEETQIDSLDGRVIDVVFTAARPGPSSDPMTSLIGIVDVSERVAVQRKLQRMQAESAHAARVSVLGELTASIAHEVNQPLAAITLNASAATRRLAAAAPDLEELRTLLGRVHRDALRAGAVIGRIQEMAAVRAVSRSDVQLHAVVNDALRFLEHDLRQKGVTAAPLRESNVQVDVDPVLIQQVVVNLVVNAAQAMSAQPEEERTITITLGMEGETAHLTVDDEGPGIPEAQLEKIFEAFVSTKSGGMGMGLSICRSILDLFGGHVVAANRPGRGARIQITLPARVGDG
jgi:PAS domain S-box-containing protein